MGSKKIIYLGLVSTPWLQWMKRKKKIASHSPTNFLLQGPSQEKLCWCPLVLLSHPHYTFFLNQLYKT